MDAITSNNKKKPSPTMLLISNKGARLPVLIKASEAKKRKKKTMPVRDSRNECFLQFYLQAVFLNNIAVNGI
ncbi:MAG: hypothetical protein GTN67_06950 [Hydrotalea flava]|nr:hypothetical protein [Hydrotalea flava]MCZ0211429.1 hypothetical protein [Streptomyces sp. UMAF16]NIM35168.1 hypothetical protein [Hydrotalea flava]NIM37989.1 hypothetical protein [Hydrotalea flava]NIN03158.1 hypothetical protein [Hydrotalea flava]